MTNQEASDLIDEVRKKGRKFTNEEKRELVLKYPAQEVADSLKGAIQSRWNYGPHLGKRGTEAERYEYVLDQVREMVVLVMPEHEEKAREIFALVPWPTVHTFGPIPTFEKLMGRVCATCGGSGVTGFLVGRRGWDC